MIMPCPDDMRIRTIAYLEERFGLAPTLFDDFTMYAGAKGRVILGPSGIPASLSPDTAGLVIARVHRSVKPTTNLLQVFGRLIQRNTIALSRANTLCYLQGSDITLGPEDRVDAYPGYVLVKYDDYPLGCGLLQENHIKNMLPRAKRLDVDFL